VHLLYTSHIFNGRGDIWHEVPLAQSQNWSQAKRIVPYIEITSTTIYSQSTNQVWEDRLWVLWNDVAYMSNRYVLGYSDDSGETWQTHGYIDRDIIGSYHVLERPRPKLASMETDSSQETGLYVFWRDHDGVKSSPVGKDIGESDEIPETALAIVAFLLLMAACMTRYACKPRGHLAGVAGSQGFGAYFDWVGCPSGSWTCLRREMRTSSEAEASNE
jgi:hypothetical protein